MTGWKQSAWLEAETVCTFQTPDPYVPSVTMCQVLSVSSGGKDAFLNI